MGLKEIIKSVIKAPKLAYNHEHNIKKALNEENEILNKGFWISQSATFFTIFILGIGFNIFSGIPLIYTIIISALLALFVCFLIYLWRLLKRKLNKWLWN